MPRRDDGDNSGLGSGFDDLNTDNADAAENAIGRFEQNTKESQTSENSSEPAPIVNEDSEVCSKYQELRDRFGTIPQGENVNSRGDVGVPSRTQKNNRVRQGVRTFAEAKATPDEVVGELEREIVNGTFSYTPLSDKAANNYVKDTSALSLIILRQTNGIWRTSMSICRIYREQESLRSAKLSELPTEI